MNLRKRIETWQIDWASRAGIPIGPPAWSPASTANGYVRNIDDNLFEPLSEEARRQLIAAAGGELDPPDGQSGNMYAVYSSSALCVNLFHRFSRAARESTPGLEVLLAACGLPAGPVSGIGFEVPAVVNSAFKVAPHLDVGISFAEGSCRYAGIESKFAEPYREPKLSVLNPAYLRQSSLWEGWPNLRAFAESLASNGAAASHFDAAQIVKHLLGLKRQQPGGFVLLYLWYDVPGEEPAARHRSEIESFARIIHQDGIPFISRTYLEVFEFLRQNSMRADGDHTAYLLDRYIDTSIPAPC